MNDTANITIKFDITNPEEKRIYDVIKKTGKRSTLVKIALSELLSKYKLDKVDDKELQSFLGGYDYIAKFKEG